MEHPPVRGQGKQVKQGAGKNDKPDTERMREAYRQTWRLPQMDQLLKNPITTPLTWNRYAAAVTTQEIESTALTKKKNL